MAVLEEALFLRLGDGRQPRELGLRGGVLRRRRPLRLRQLLLQRCQLRPPSLESLDSLALSTSRGIGSSLRRWRRACPAAALESCMRKRICAFSLRAARRSRSRLRLSFGA